jgi:TonB family protein
MSSDIRRKTILDIPLIEERYGRSLAVSIAAHGALLLILIYGGYLLPSAVIQIGSGPGGGEGGDIPTVGVVDELSGGAGMVKPSLVPKPPALPDEVRPVPAKAIPVPQTLEPRKKPQEKARKEPVKPLPNTNVIPVAAEPGSGGVGGRSGGTGGGVGGGSGLSIGTGSGGFGDSWYARAVESRISSNWIRPPEGVRVEMIYSFYIASDGTINDIRQQKSSGNAEMDLTAERAIRASNPLAPPPQEFRGRRIQFIAQFVFPPGP